jgi:hypothetical protein
MRRLYYAPLLMNRQKPGTFRFNPQTANGWDSRLAALRLRESGGAADQRHAKAIFGKTWDMALAYKKERYG